MGLTPGSKIYSATLELINCYDHTNIIKAERKIELAVSLQHFVEDAITKYIKGQKEHGDNITNRNLDNEIYQEIQDIFWYSRAKIWKKDNGH